MPLYALLAPQVPQARLIGCPTTMSVQIAVSVLPLASTTFDVKV